MQFWLYVCHISHVGLGEEGPSVPFPRILRPTGGAHFARVAAGAMHSLGLTSSGQLYAWGDGSFGALGDSPSASLPLPSCLEHFKALP